ncbi:MAG: nitronate monooxygenase [Nitrospirae bacterium]|nr:nitronate monooxygenase [Nitrospirota bacterium]MBF0541677.1 nitronate monooxygenase [Nitrospirota bacterium]
MKTKEHKVLPTLRIGDLEIYPPIIQGGMGVRVSRSGLASAVANTGCVGVIASVCLGDFEHLPPSKFVEVNQQALRDEIRKARKLSNGIIGVNIMVALTNYNSLVIASLEEGADLIISGAGLPFELPKFVTPSQKTKLIPIVSSARAFNVIAQRWLRRYNRLPDAVVVEGPMAGGHLGFAFDDVIAGTTPKLEDIIVDVVAAAKAISPEKLIPVIAAGGVFYGADIVKFINLGASGVQMATRFVCTDECDVDDNFKQMYLRSTKDDITIVRSPVGMPGRVFRNEFVDKVKHGDTAEKYCTFKCLKTCNPKAIPYCISKVLSNAAAGNLDAGFVFTGANGWRCNEIIPVKTLVQKLIDEADVVLNPA